MLDKELHIALRRAFHHSNKAIIQGISDLGLLPGQPKILEYLLEHDGCISKEIGKSCLLDKSTVANLLPRMERQGLIVKEEHKSDKRAASIRLTDKGAALAQKVKDVCGEVDRRALEGIPAKQQEEFRETLQIIVSNLQEEEA